jgi:hypothetical protein
MGVPVKVIIDKQAVFLCCTGCEEDAQRNAAKTLNKVKDLKSKAQEEKHNH